MKIHYEGEHRALGRVTVRGRVRIYHLNLPTDLIGGLLCIPDAGQSDSTSLIPTVKRLRESKTGSNVTLITNGKIRSHFNSF